MQLFYRISSGIALLLAGLCCAGGTVFAQAPPPGLEAAFSRFEQDPQLRYGIAALCVLDARTGKLVFARNADKGLLPASSMKTLTAATALNLLGSDYRFETRLAYTGTIGPDGVLKGDLVIHGGGDPSLASWRWQETKEESLLQAWVDLVRSKGIRRIEGRILGDDGLMDYQTVPGGWQWVDIGNYYGAGAGALNWRENLFDVLLQPSAAAGGPVRVLGTRPEMDYLQFVNELQTGARGSGDQAYVYLPPYREVAYLRGTYGLDQQKKSISGAVPDPAFECAYRVRKALEGAGIQVPGEVSTRRRLALRGESFPSQTVLLGRHLSPTLDKLVYWFNQKSINLYGESLLKAMALNAGKRGNTRAGIQVLKDFWALQGLDTNSLAITDGSGLSPSNRITAASLARVLLDARKRSWYPAFYESLPQQNGLRMKSGYIQGVRAYAGYHTSKDGTPYVFVFFVNNFNGSPSSVRLKMWRVLDSLK